MVVSIAATIGMLVLGAIAKVLTRDWFHPAPLFAVLWGCACGIAIVIAPENITSASGPLWILLNVALVIGGSIAGAACSGRNRRSRAESAGNAKLCSPPKPNHGLSALTAICVVLGLLYALLWLRSQGVRADQIATLKGLGQTALRMSVARYSKTGNAVTIYLQTLLGMAYLAPLFGGTLFVLRHNRKQTGLAFISLLPSLVIFATQSTRSTTLFGATLWASGYISTRLRYGMTIQRLRPGAIAVGALGIPMLLLLIAAGDALRDGGANPGAGRSFLTDRTKTYMCGHIAALSMWMDDSDLSTIQPAIGQYTLAGLYELVHPGTRVNGVIGEYSVITTGSTNVYTYFRQLIEDATSPGALLVMLSLAFCGGLAYSHVRQGRRSWMGVLAAFYACALFGITSILNYNSILGAFALYGLWWFVPDRQQLCTSESVRGVQ